MCLTHIPFGQDSDGIFLRVTWGYGHGTVAVIEYVWHFWGVSLLSTVCWDTILIPLGPWIRINWAKDREWMNSLSYHFTTILWDAPAMSSPPSLWINSVCFSSISFSICSGVTCIDPFVSRCVRLLQRAVCQLVQTDSFRLARCRCLRRPDGTEEASLSRDSKCKCAPHKCRGINEYVFMCAAHVDPYICMYDSFTLSWSPGCVHALMDMYKHALSRYVCLCVSVLVCVRWEDPWSSALCFQRIAWLPSLYEPWVQSDRNKKPYSALGIRKTGFGIKEQGHTHADTQTQTQTHRHLSDRGHQAKGIILRGKE